MSRSHGSVFGYGTPIRGIVRRCIENENCAVQPLRPTVHRPAPRPDSAGSLRRAVGCSYAVLSERDPVRQRELVAAHTLDLWNASAVRAYEPGADGWQLSGISAGAAVPELAARMEQELLPRALAEGISLISSHPALDPDLESLAATCRERGITTHVLLVRANRETHGAFGVHWLGRERPPYEQRAGFYYYWDAIGIAIAATNERQRVETNFAELRRRAFWDRLTGLPNALALEDELRRNAQTMPLGVLALDFDGMREANTAFGFTEGGDLLIRAVGRGLAAATTPGEFAARMYTAGDEFAVLLPGADEEAALARALEIEKELDELTVPETHRTLYQGASVGSVSRLSSESPGQALGRAIEVMRRRKLARRDRRSPD